MLKPEKLISGEWRNEPNMLDYRSEWLSDVFVERATWGKDADSRQLREVTAEIEVAGPGFVWLRFWLKEEDQVLEKYFDAEGQAVGFYIPVCMPFQQNGSTLATQTLAMALWYNPDGQLTVLGESEFDRAVEDSTMTPVEVEHAEHRVRELIMSVLNRSFPPGLVRNFSVLVE
jgi:predicted RNA-binding protein associated with RNAse of E/G family